MSWPDNTSTSMRHDEIRELLGVYALDAVDRREAAAVEAHLAICPECRSEVDAHRAAASCLVDVSDEAPARVWDQLQDDIYRADVADSRVRRSNLSPFLGIAAALLVFAGLVVQTVRLDQTKAELALAEQRSSDLELALAAGDLQRAATLASANPSATTAVIEGSLGAGTVIILPNGVGFLIGENLPRLDEQHTYQLWAVQAGEVVSAGILGSSPGVTTFTIERELLEGLVITAEESGGVAQSQETVVSAWFPET